MFAGLQYNLELQVYLESGVKYHHTHIQDTGEDQNVTIFLEELGKKVVVSGENFQPLQQASAWVGELLSKRRYRCETTGKMVQKGMKNGSSLLSSPAIVIHCFRLGISSSLLSNTL